MSIALTIVLQEWIIFSSINIITVVRRNCWRRNARSSRRVSWLSRWLPSAVCIGRSVCVTLFRIVILDDRTEGEKRSKSAVDAMIRLFSLKEQQNKGTDQANGSTQRQSAAQLRIQKGEPCVLWRLWKNDYTLCFIQLCWIEMFLKCSPNVLLSFCCFLWIIFCSMSSVQHRNNYPRASRSNIYRSQWYCSVD